MEITANKFIRKNMDKLNEQRLVGKYCDLTLVCQGREFTVHKSVLASSSEYFETMLDSGFKESTSEKIELEGFTPDSLEVVLEYLYTGHMRLNMDIAVQALNTFSFMMLDEAVQQIDSKLVKEASTNLQGVLDVVLEFSGAEKARKAVIDLILELAPSERTVILSKLNGDMMSGLVQRGGNKCDAFFTDILNWMKEKSESEVVPVVEKLDLSQLSTSSVLAVETLHIGTNPLDVLLLRKYVEVYRNEKRGVISFTVPSISKLGTDYVYSPKVGVSGLLWRCSVSRKTDSAGDSMSLFVWCCGNNESEHYECEVISTYKLLGVEKYQRLGSRYNFTTGSKAWGYDTFVPWKDLVDPTKGYVTNDEARVEIEILIEAVSIVWKQ